MTKIVELQRHTAADSTLLIAEDVRAALQIGRGSRRRLRHPKLRYWRKEM